MTIESVLGAIQIISECKQYFERNERNERCRGWRNSNGNSLLYAWCMLHMFHRTYFLCTCTFHSIPYFHDMQFTCKYIRTLNISVLSSFFREKKNIFHFRFNSIILSSSTNRAWRKPHTKIQFQRDILVRFRFQFTVCTNTR